METSTPVAIPHAEPAVVRPPRSAAPTPLWAVLAVVTILPPPTTSTATTALAVGLALEVFNVFNRANFAIPSQRTVFTTSGAVGSAGLITATTTTARQMQLGLRVSF